MNINHSYSLDEVEVEACAFPLDAAPRVAGEGHEAEEELAEEAQVPKQAREPGEPTDEERKRHETTHLPFRSWCRYCVYGRL